MDKRQTLAQALYDALNIKKFDNGIERVILNDGSPAWMLEAIHACHNGLVDMGPDDFKYRMIQEIAGDLADIEDWSDRDNIDTGSIADNQVDIYNWDRLKWVSSHLLRACYVDEARDEGYTDEKADLMERLGQGQYMEYREIADTLVSAIEKQAEEESEEQDESE